MNRRYWTTFFFLAFATACFDGTLVIDGQRAPSVETSSADDPANSSDPSGELGTPSQPVDVDVEVQEPPEACDGATPARLWRLSHAQYDNSVGDLLGTSLRLAREFEPETSGTGFRSGAAVGFVSETLASQYQQAAQSLAEEAVSDAVQLLGCEADDEACVHDFIDDFGRRAFRKPLTDEQRELYRGVYATGAAVDPEFGVQLVIEAMLQSPHFLYRFELGTPGASVGDRAELDAWEMAAQLSYLLWNTMPDDALFARAEDGTLLDRDVLQSEVERMLADPKARRIFSEFFELYFGLDRAVYLEKNDEMFPEFTPGVAQSLAREGAAFVEDVAWDEAGTLGDLFTAQYSFVNEDLASLYGIDGVEGDDLVRVALPPGERAGILTQAGFLALNADEDTSSPTHRGLFVRARLLCQSVAEPPADVADDIQGPTESDTTRQRYEEHMSNPSCVGCHRLMDPIGFGLENYDAAGRYRQLENGNPIDSSGEMFGTGEIDGAFDGPQQLGALLAESDAVSDCVATHFFRFALGRLESEADRCELNVMQTRFRAYDSRLVSLVGIVLSSGAFRHREIR